MYNNYKGKYQKSNYTIITYLNLIELGEGVHECTTLCGGLPAVFIPEED